MLCLMAMHGRSIRSPPFFSMASLPLPRFFSCAAIRHFAPRRCCRRYAEAMFDGFSFSQQAATMTPSHAFLPAARYAAAESGRSRRHVRFVIFLESAFSDFISPHAADFFAAFAPDAAAACHEFFFCRRVRAAGCHVIFHAVIDAFVMSPMPSQH